MTSCFYKHTVTVAIYASCIPNHIGVIGVPECVSNSFVGRWSTLMNQVQDRVYWRCQLTKSMVGRFLTPSDTPGRWRPVRSLFGPDPPSNRRLDLCKRRLDLFRSPHGRDTLRSPFTQVMRMVTGKSKDYILAH